MTLTYAELDTITDLLADNLRAKGLKVDSAASIYMDRSANYVISYIAILKAGWYRVFVNEWIITDFICLNGIWYKYYYNEFWYCGNILFE